jgi:hypothetical protein
MKRLFMLVLILCGCGAEPGWDLREQALATGGRVGDLTAAGPTVVLLLSPEDVFTCGSHVSMWMEWARRGGTLRVIFTREPTASEKQHLATARISDFHVLARATRRRLPDTPREYLVMDGEVRYSMDVRAGQLGSALLTRAQQGRLAEVP